MQYLLLITSLLIISCQNINQSIKETKENTISLVTDKYGIAYINAQNINDGLYALGYMHARDRIFQLDALRHLSQGKLAQLIGEHGLYFDKKTRLLSYDIAKQEELLSNEDKELIKSYIDGINKSIQTNKPSIEHRLLKVKCENFDIKDIIAISRFYVWILGNDLHSELARFHIANMKLPKNLKDLLLAPIDSNNSHIFLEQTNYPDKLKDFSYNFSHEEPKISNLTQDDFTLAASNAWAINGNSMENNHAVIMNDPHLKHEFPSNFYMASIQVQDQLYFGASLVGLPAIVIGSGNNVSFGVTAALTNTQDAIILDYDFSKKTYKVDNKEYILDSWQEKFCIKDKNECQTKTYYKSIFGPIINEEFNSLVPKNMMIALRWTGFLHEYHKEIISPFFKLAQAKDVFSAIDVINKMTLTGVNFLVADTQKNIGYGFAGLLLQKHPHQHPFLPLDGSLKNNIEPLILSGNNKKSIINPKNNFLITANQNLFEQLDKNNTNSYGLLGAESYRANRIRQQILEQKNNGKMNINELQKIQIDATSLEAQELAPLLGDACLKYMSNSFENKQFAQVLKDFDGNFNTQSYAALPYHFLINEIIDERIMSILKSMSFKGVFHINSLIKKHLIKALKQQDTAIFPSVSLWSEYMKNRCQNAYINMTKKTGKDLWRYRYGRHHYLQRKSQVSLAPIIGKFFKDIKREIAGYHSAPMAEGGLPVNYGANLRMWCEMSNPPKLHMVIDSGNNGDFHHPNSLDQAKLWHNNQAIMFYENFYTAQNNAKEFFMLNR